MNRNSMASIEFLLSPASIEHNPQKQKIEKTHVLASYRQAFLQYEFPPSVHHQRLFEAYGISKVITYFGSTCKFTFVANNVNLIAI